MIEIDADIKQFKDILETALTFLSTSKELSKYLQKNLKIFKLVHFDEKMILIFFSEDKNGG